MIKAEWLQAYGTKEGIIYTFQKMDERTKFPSNFKEALDHLEEAYDLYENEFNGFFPELIQYVDEQCNC